MANQATHRLLSFNPHQIGVLMGTMYGIFGLIAGLFFVIVGITVASERAMIALGVAAPIIYAVMGYFFAIVSVTIFNWVAAKVGGIEMTVTVVEEQQST